jgi:ferredoxin-NAD(P)+ reductase (naphthalene dioxygenase ferredoxin-specific)
MPQIHISDWPHSIEAGRRRILDAALDAGVPFPHGCASGECGSCKCRLVDGEVASEACSPDALSDEESRQGLILACRSRPTTDVTVAWLSDRPALPVLRESATVTGIERVAHDVVTLSASLHEGRPFPFRPGQFAKLRFGRLPARSYSMASQPGRRELEFHVRMLDGGQVSGHVANAARIGDRLEVHGPFGEACWEAGTRAPCLLMVAGGTGLAPILSVLDAALSDGHDPRCIHVYHGVRTERDLYAWESLRRRERDHGVRFVPVFSESGPGRAGMVHEAVRGDFADLAGSLVHVAGPPPMVDAVRSAVTALGVGPERVRADAFHASSEPPARPGLLGRIGAWVRA